VLLTLFVSAGIWQLGRAGQKHDLNAAFSAGTLTEVIGQLVADADANDYRFRRFQLQGRYDTERQILLDSIVEGGRIGYQVLTPFHSDGKTVMVNRGWLPADSDRNVLPSIDVGGDERSIKARLNRFPVPGMRLEASPPLAGEWPQRLLFPDRAAIVAALNEEVPDYQLLLDADEADGFERNWRAVDVGPERHYGYAFQWFAFATMALVIYGILNVRWNREYKKQQQTKAIHD